MEGTWSYTTKIMLDGATTIGRVIGWMCVRYGDGDDHPMLSPGDGARRWGYRVGISNASGPYVVISTDDPGIHTDLRLSW